MLGITAGEHRVNQIHQKAKQQAQTHLYCTYLGKALQMLREVAAMPTIIPELCKLPQAFKIGAA